MEWNGKLHPTIKYANSTWKKDKIGFVQLVRNAVFDEDGYLDATVSVNLYDTDSNNIEMYIPASDDLSPYSLADYILCDIQDAPDINVQK